MQTRLLAHWKVLHGPGPAPSRKSAGDTPARAGRPTVAPGPVPVGALAAGVTCTDPGFWFGGGGG